MSRSSSFHDFPSRRRFSISAVMASKRASESGVCSIKSSPSMTRPRLATASSIAAISSAKSSATALSQEPTTFAAVSSRFCASRSSPVSCRTLRSAAATSASLATSASASPSLLRRQDSAKEVGLLRRRFPRISTAKLPERRRRRSPLAISFLTALRNSSNAAPSAASVGLICRSNAFGG